MRMYPINGTRNSRRGRSRVVPTRDAAQPRAPRHLNCERRWIPDDRISCWLRPRGWLRISRDEVATAEATVARLDGFARAAGRARVRDGTHSRTTRISRLRLGPGARVGRDPPRTRRGNESVAAVRRSDLLRRV